MILTKEDLKTCLTEDLKRIGGHEPGLRDRFLHNESWYIWKYIKLLRLLEYYENNRNKNMFYKLRWLYLVRKHKIASVKTGYFAHPNTIGSGFVIYHNGTILISKTAQIGKNFTIRPGCVIGNIGGTPEAPIIGDNVELSLGVKIFGKTKIGRGAILNANCVPMANIPPYAIVVGNPGKIVGFTKSPAEVVEFEKEHYNEEDRIPLETLEKNYKKYFLDRIKDIRQFTKI